MSNYDLSHDVQNILTTWDAELITDGQTVDELLELIEEPYPELYTHIIGSTDCLADNYLTDHESIIYIIEYFRRQHD